MPLSNYFIYPNSLCHALSSPHPSVSEIWCVGCYKRGQLLCNFQYHTKHHILTWSDFWTLHFAHSKHRNVIECHRLCACSCPCFCRNLCLHRRPSDSHENSSVPTGLFGACTEFIWKWNGILVKGIYTVTECVLCLTAWWFFQSSSVISLSNLIP